MEKLTVKQQFFCDEYLKNGCNGTQAYLSVYKNVKSVQVATVNSTRLLKKNCIRTYIDERLDGIKSQNTANIQEIMEYLTSVMRGIAESEEITMRGVVVKKPSEKDKLKAAELLGKAFGMFTEHIDMDVTVPMFVGECELED